MESGSESATYVFFVCSLLSNFERLNYFFKRPFKIMCTFSSHRTTCLFNRLEESSLVPAGFLTAQFLQET